MNRHLFLPAVSAISFLAAVPFASALEIRKSDTVCIIGNTFGEQLQFSGYFEALLHARHAESEVSVFNLSWPADTLSLKPRPHNSPSQDQLLTRYRAGVIIACFGLNESYETPLPQFRQQLESFIDHTLKQKYDGSSAPRLVLISPVAHEQLEAPGLPVARKRNDIIEQYVQVMAEVCRSRKVEFADIFHPLLEQYNKEPKRKLTSNGIHLNEDGERFVSSELDFMLFGPPRGLAAKWTQERMELLRQAVIEKNQQFWYRFRPLNPFYIYGGRTRPFGEASFPPEQTYLDGMVANRHRRIWEIAQGKSSELKVDDSNLKALPDYPSTLKDDAKILTPDEEAKSFTLLDGFEVNLFASEAQFPDVSNPVQITFDAAGRLWLTTIPSFPHILPGSEPNDKVLILSDKDADGRADSSTTFADGLYMPLGIELGYGGAYVSAPPNLLYLRDRDGDGKADQTRTLLRGFGTEDSHHAISAFCWGPGGGLHMMEGTFLHSQVETPWGPQRMESAGVWRYEPAIEKLGIHISYPYANPWGQTWDRWGRNTIADASGGDNHYGNAYSGWLPYPDKHRALNRFTPMEAHLRPTAGCEVVSSRHFPDEFQGWWLLNNNIGFQGTRMFRIADDGSGFKATEWKDLIRSSDPNFRPVDLEFGPDGALYIVDWYNPIIGHTTYSMRDPQRDKKHGRIWRVTAKGRPAVKPPAIAGAKISELLELLRTPEDRTRYRVRRELAQRDTPAVLTAVEKFAAALKDGDPDKEHLLLECLWVTQHHNAVQSPLLQRAFTSSEPKARAAAVHVLRWWHDRIPDSLAMLKQAAQDDYPAVRLESVVAASFLRSTAGVEVAMLAAEKDTDYYLDYAIGETLRALEPQWREAIAQKAPFVFQNAKGLARLLRSLSAEELKQLPASPAVEAELQRREGLSPEQSTALKELNDPAADTAAIVAKAKDDPAALLALSSIAPRVAEKTRAALAEQLGTLAAKLPDSLAAKLSAGVPATGRYVRIELPRKGTLSLTEVEVMAGGRNIALNGGNTTQSSTAQGGVASRAIDGGTHGEWGRQTTTMTEEQDNPWWELDFGNTHAISHIAITNRNDYATDTASALNGFKLTILDADRRPVFVHQHETAPARIDIPVKLVATALQSALIRAWGASPVQAEEKFKTLLPLLSDATLRPATISAVAALDIQKSPAEAREPAATVIKDVLMQTPLSARTSADFVAAVQFARHLSTVAAEPKGLASLADLESPAPLTLKADALQLIYTEKQLTAKAGGVIALTFENPGEQPHNAVICAPGSLEKVGAAADAMQTDPNGLASGFVPAIPEVLHKTRLLNRGEKETLLFRAPTEPGDYVIVCTFPGHWRLMNAILKVNP